MSDTAYDLSGLPTQEPKARPFLVGGMNYDTPSQYIVYAHTAAEAWELADKADVRLPARCAVWDLDDVGSLDRTIWKLAYDGKRGPSRSKVH